MGHCSAGALYKNFDHVVPNLFIPEFAWMNVYEHRFAGLTLPGHGELRNKEFEYALR